MTLRHHLCAALLLAMTPLLSPGALISGIPGPNDQGGMIMPMVTIQATAGSGSNPTAGQIQVSFDVLELPRMRSLEEWQAGSWFAEDAAWRHDLGSPVGVGGTPEANAGKGDLFNNQYGFMFMSMNAMLMAAIPEGKSLAIRLDSVSSADMKFFNYSAGDNRWDEIFMVLDDQVLWSGTMWHNYFTLPSGARPGLYSVVFEVFIADSPFSGVTGAAQYDTIAAGAVMDPNFVPALITYDFQVVPEAADYSLGLGVIAVGLVLMGRLGKPRR